MQYADDLAEFFASKSPKTDADKALVVGYYLQYKAGLEILDSQRINSELKNLGYGISNITRTLEHLKSKRPALILQTRKQGTTKQARKLYRLTMEGKRYVEEILNPDRVEV